MLEFLYGINEYLFEFFGYKYHNLFALCFILMTICFIAFLKIENSYHKITYKKSPNGDNNGHTMKWVSLIPLKIILFSVATILFLVFPFSCSKHEDNKDSTKLIENETRKFKVGDVVTVPNQKTLYTCIKDSSKNAAVFGYLAYRGASEAKAEINYREYITGPIAKKHWWGSEEIGSYKVITYICTL